MTDTLIQIVPRRAIAAEGVGDYARIIAERLRADHGLRTIFVSGSPLSPEQRLRDEWETHELPTRGTAPLLDALAAVGGADTPLLVHHSGYGYHDKGVPFWLARALEDWRARHPVTPLATIFHEIYATGRITGSAFWLGPLQKRVAHRILRVSTGALATTEPYSARLQRWAHGTPPVVNMPVFSTIGETAKVMPASQRPPTMVVFGRAGIFQSIYRDGLATVEAFVARHGIVRIVDIGARHTSPPASIGGAAVEALGEMPADILQDRLAHARFGLVHYNADRLAKSTIFAAYCAQGAIPVCLSDSPGFTDGVTPGTDYIRLGDGTSDRPFDAPALDALQAAAMKWYGPHSLTATIETICGLLHPQQPAGD